MSKSKGNVIPLVEIPQKYGADIFRMYTISMAEPGTVMDWREKDVPSVRNRMQQFIDIVTKHGKKPPKIFQKKDKPSMVTRWVLSKINSIIKESTENLENHKLRDYAIQVTSEMTRTINQYLRRKEVPKDEREGTMAYICDVWVRLMAPMTPHISEELWAKMKRDGYVSLTAWPKVDSKLIDSKVEQAHEVVESTIKDIREITRLLKGKDVSTVHVYVAPQWMFDAMNSIRDANLPLIVGNIMKHLMSDPEFRTHGKAVKSIVDRIAKENGLWNHSVTAKDELSTLTSSIDYMSSEVGLKLSINSSEKPEYDPQNKARFALPGRVSLYLE